MSGAIYMAVSGTANQQMQFGVISNNLANANTIGFKADRSAFRMPELEVVKDESAQEKMRLSASFLPFDSFINFDSGPIQHTGNPLDLALEGDGFFCINVGDETQYTRKGDFTVNEKGILVTQNGFPVLGDGGEIKIEGEKCTIGIDGNIMVDGDKVDTIKIVDFEQPYKFKKMEKTLFALIDAETETIKPENVTVHQECVERSNVNPVRAMTRMIEALRGYESYNKFVVSTDRVNSKTVNDIGRLA